MINETKESAKKGMALHVVFSLGAVLFNLLLIVYGIAISVSSHALMFGVACILFALGHLIYVAVNSMIQYLKKLIPKIRGRIIFLLEDCKKRQKLNNDRREIIQSPTLCSSCKHHIETEIVRINKEDEELIQIEKEMRLNEKVIENFLNLDVPYVKVCTEGDEPNIITTFFLYTPAVVLCFFQFMQGSSTLYALPLIQTSSVMLISLMIALIVSAKELYRILAHKANYVQSIEVQDIQVRNYGWVLYSLLVGLFIWSLFFSGMLGVIYTVLTGAGTATTLAYLAPVVLALYHLRGDITGLYKPKPKYKLSPQMKFPVYSAKICCLLSFFLYGSLSIIALMMGGLSLPAKLACYLALGFFVIYCLAYLEAFIRVRLNRTTIKLKKSFLGRSFTLTFLSIFRQSHEPLELSMVLPFFIGRKSIEFYPYFVSIPKRVMEKSTDDTTNNCNYESSSLGPQT